MINGLVHAFWHPFVLVGPGPRHREPPDSSLAWEENNEKKKRRPETNVQIGNLQRGPLCGGARVYQPSVIVAKNERRKESFGTFDVLMSCWRDHNGEILKSVGLFSNVSHSRWKMANNTCLWNGKLGFCSWAWETNGRDRWIDGWTEKEFILK